MKCINKNLEPIKELLNDFKEPVLSKILDSFPDDYIPTKEEALAKYSELLGSSVDYKLKVINALQSDKVRQPNKNFQGFLNDLQKQGVPKDQIELLNQVYQEGDTKEDLAIKLASNYSFSIEINTAKARKDAAVNNFNDEGFRGNDDFYYTSQYEENGYSYYKYDVGGNQFSITEKDFNLAKNQSELVQNSSYYSNLTVPGGTNYTENEISIPGQLVEEKPQGVPVKEGVPELFESNPELANAVYEALGYDISNIDLKINRVGNRINVVTSSSNNKAQIDIDIEDKNAYITNTFVEKEQQGFGTLSYIKLANELIKQGLTLTSDLNGIDLQESGKALWESLVSKNLAFYNSNIGRYVFSGQQAQQLYSQYLDTVFPDSKVTLSKKFADTYNIVFNEEIIGTIDIPSDLEGDTISIGDVNIKPEFRGKGLGVETYKAAMKIAEKPLESFMATDEANRVWNSLIKQGLAKKTDTGFITTIPLSGSKQDIEGFKEFVNGKIFDKELAQKIQDKLQKLYPEIKLNITNTPVWEQGDNVFNQLIEDDYFEGNSIKYQNEIEKISNLILNKLKFKLKEFNGKYDESITTLDEYKTKILKDLLKNIGINGVTSLSQLKDRLNSTELQTSLKEELQTAKTKKQEYAEQLEVFYSTRRLLNNFLKHFDINKYNNEQQAVIKSHLPSLFKENKFKSDKQAVAFSKKQINSTEWANKKFQLDKISIFFLGQNAKISKIETLINYFKIDKQDAVERIYTIVENELNRREKFFTSEKTQSKINAKLAEDKIKADNEKAERLRIRNEELNKYKNSTVVKEVEGFLGARNIHDLESVLESSNINVELATIKNNGHSLDKTPEGKDSKLFASILNLPEVNGNVEIAKKLKSLVYSEDFINWFGDWLNNPEESSKIVDENGEPKLVYHGSGREFSNFEEKERGSTTGKWKDRLSDSEMSFMFTDSPNTAFYYAIIERQQILKEILYYVRRAAQEPSTQMIQEMYQKYPAIKNWVEGLKQKGLTKGEILQEFKRIYNEYSKIRDLSEGGAIGNAQANNENTKQIIDYLEKNKDSILKKGIPKNDKYSTAIIPGSEKNGYPIWLWSSKEYNTITIRNDGILNSFETKSLNGKNIKELSPSEYDLMVEEFKNNFVYNYQKIQEQLQAGGFRPKVYPVFLNAKNVNSKDFKKRPFVFQEGDTKEVVERRESKGAAFEVADLIENALKDNLDGSIIENIADPTVSTNYAVFRSNQIKSVFNKKDYTSNDSFYNQIVNKNIVGQANIKAMTVLVDAINQKQDTLPHEYAHHYIAWFRNTPIVQEAIKKWGSEEALVQSIGEQVVKQKGEAYNWWNNFVKWIMNQFNSLSKLQKEELTQILTDAFLTRQDLGGNQDIEGFKSFIKSNTKTVRKGAITPSIRGHAEFATENGIGWFRSDDRQSNSTINSQNNDEKKEKKIKPNDTWRDVYRKIDNDLLRMPVDEVLDFINEAKEFLNNSKDAQNKEQYLEKLSVQEKAVKEELKLKKAAQENGRSYIEPSSWNAPNYDGNTNTYGHVTSSKALFDIIFGNGELDVNYTQDGKLIYLNKGGEGQAARIRINGSFGLVNLIFDAELLKEAGIEIHKGIEAHTRENIPLKYLTKKSKKFVLDAILNELDRRGEKLTDEQAQKIAESLGYNSWKELQQDLKDTSTGLEQKPIKNSSDNSKTRRILEVQSDLFQKGRASDLLVNTLNRNRKDNIRILELNNISYDRELTKEEQDELKKLNEPNFNEKGNQFLQLLNKDNNWVKFFVQSIIQDSVKKGYEKVLFPTGNTASRIEGHSTLEEFKKQKEDRIKELEKDTNKNKQALKDGYYLEDFRGLRPAEKEYLTGTTRKQTEETINRNNNEINQLKQELERVETEGFAALAPIFKFYEETVYNTIKKLYPVNRIKDEYGNEWYEVELSTKRDIGEVYFSKTQDSIFKKDVGLNKKEIDVSNQSKINKKVKLYNAKNNTSYYIKWNRVGQSNLYNWEIVNYTPQPQSYYSKPNQLESEQVSKEEKFNSSEVVPKMKQILEVLGISTEISTNIFKNQQRINSLKALPQTKETKEQIEKLESEGYLDDVEALADILNRVITFSEGNLSEDNFTEETIHFIVDILEQKDQKLFNVFMDKVRGYKIYSDTLEVYKTDPNYRNADNSINYYKIKKEAIAKLLTAKLINNDYIEDKKELLASLWEALSNFIKSLFGKLDYTLKDEFTEFADKINSNYITKSDRQYLGNQTFAKRKETPKNKLNKSKRLFGTSSTSELDYNSSPSQVRAYFESLRDKFSKTIAKNEQGEEEEVYVFDGKNKVRATSIANSKGAFEGINQSEWAKLLRDAKLQKGNTVHKTIEDIINRYIDKNTGKRLETPYKAPETLEVSADVYLKLQEHVVNRLNSYPKGTLFSTELPVVNEEDGYAGTIDFIAFLPNGKIDILDWKTMDINYKMGTEKFQRFDVSPFNQAYWRNQLTLYKNAIASHILVPANKDIFRYTRAIPIATDMEAKLVDKSKGFKPENMYYTIKSVKIGDVNPEKIKKEEFFLTPVAIRTELTGDKKLDEVVSKLWGIYDKIQTTTYSKDEKYKKKIESDRILSAIRELQVKKTATLFTGLFNDSFNRFKEIYKKKPEFINNLKKGQKVLEKTQEEQLTDYLTNLYDAISFLSAFDKFPNTVRSLYEEKETTDYDKVVLRETLRLWRDAGDVKTSLIEETENVLTKLAEAYGIDDFTGYDSQNSNSLLNWTKDSLHRDEKSIQLTTRIINAIGIISDQRSKLYFSDEGKFTTARKKFEEWATKNKKSLQEAYSHLLQKDNGKTIRKLISKLKPEYFTEIITKQKEFTELYNSIEESLIKQGYKGVMLKNELYKKYKEQITPWLKENFDIEKYNQLYQEALKKYTESLKDIRADEDDIIDKQKKEKWLQDWVNENNILINPRTLFNKYSPLFKALKEEKWYSNEYKFLLKSENKALLETYNLFQEINKYARNIGMLDDVKESWAFLPAIEEFGFWGAIKAIFLGKIKNLLKKHVEINPDIDPITGRESKKIPVLYKYVNEDSKDFLSNDLFYTFSIWADHIIKYEMVSQMEFRFKAIQLIESLKEYENPVTSNGNLAVSINNKLDVWDKTRLAKRVKGRGVENDLEDYINMHIYGTSDVKPAYYKLLDLIYNYTALNFLGISATSWVSNFVGGRFSASLLSGKHFSKSDFDIAAFAVMGVYNKDLLKRGENIPKKSMWLIDNLGTTIESQYDTSKFDKFRDSKIHINNLAFAGFKAGDHFIQNNIATAIFMNTTIRDGKFVNINDLVKEKYPDLYNKPQKERIELSKKIDKEIAELKKTDNLFHYIETKDNKFLLKGINLNSSEGQSELIRYQNMIKSYIKDAIGNTDPWDMSILRMKWYAKFLTQFKNWMFRVVGSKFSSLENKYDRDRFSYGRTRIYFKTAFSKYFLPIVAEQIKSLIPLVPYADAKTGNVKLLEASKDFYQQKKLEFAKQGKPFNLSEREFTDLYLNGIKNQIREFNGLIALMLIVSIIGAGLDDDDNLLDPIAPEFDKTKWQWKVLSRILFKFKRELFFNYDPEQGFNMFKNPIPVIGAIAQLWDATQAVAKEPVLRLTGDESDENENHAWDKVMNATPLVRELHFWALATSEDYADWVGVNQPKVDL